MAHPSIFNDVIGPVMRGPSSSHCAAANRIGLLAYALMNGKIAEIEISFDTNGSLATTHESQGSDMGLFGGLLGWDCRDERIVTAQGELPNVIGHQIVIDDFGYSHPNTYHLKLRNETETHELIAISTGGGMVEVVGIDGFGLSMLGDSHDLLVFMHSPDDDVVALLRDGHDQGKVSQLDGGTGLCFHARSMSPWEPGLLSDLRKRPGVCDIKVFSPVVPVLTPEAVEVPFTTCDEMIAFDVDSARTLAGLALAYESARGDVSECLVFEQVMELVDIWRRSIGLGLKGTAYEDRILGSQSPNLVRCNKAGKLADGGALNTIVAYVSALMEVKSSMGLIVAAPTAGACAALPGALIALADHHKLDDQTIARGILAAGLIGVFIAESSTFAAEVAGCQAECGSASGMAAAGIAEMMGGTRDQTIAAASMALQNSLGMVCDPVANRVEVPCLGKNVMAASNALSCANMALADFDPVVTLDEVIATMDVVGRSIPHELRCTALGGLSLTATSKRIQKELKDRKGK